MTEDEVRDVRLLLEGLKYLALCYGAEYGHGEQEDVVWALEGREDVLDAYRRLGERIAEGRIGSEHDGEGEA